MIARGRLGEETTVGRGRERFDPLASGDGVRVERIVSLAAASPPGHWDDQETEEWVLLVSGAAGLEQETPPRVLELGPGDWARIPAGCRHRVAWTADDEPTVWVAVHYRPES
jgi:cupin 2 domain-containing protein